MNAIQRKRLLKLADFLAGPVAKADREARKEGRFKFDMGSWCKWNNDAALEEHGYNDPRKVGLDKASCGTAACALGWATNVWPEKLGFTRDGFVFMRSARWLDPLAIGIRFFGLNESQAERAFYGGPSRTAKQEAALLRRMARS